MVKEIREKMWCHPSIAICINKNKIHNIFYVNNNSFLDRNNIP